MRFRTDEEPDPTEERPFWRQPAWQLSAVFVLLVLLAGIVTVVIGLPDSREHDSTRTAKGPLTTPLTDGATRPPGCVTDDRDQQPPSQPSDDITWRPLNGTKIPLSPSAGPLQQHGTMLWCFAHTPMGAVMAANIIPRHMSGADWRQVTEQQVVADTQREVFVARRSSITTTTVQYTANSPAGFMVVAYSPESATVRLLIRQPGAEYVATDLTLAWDNGDWKLQVLSGGELYTAVRPVAATTGFVLWKV